MLAHSVCIEATQLGSERELLGSWKSIAATKPYSATYTPNTGTIPKFTAEYIKKYIQYAKSRGKREAHVVRNMMRAEYV